MQNISANTEYVFAGFLKLGNTERADFLALISFYEKSGDAKRSQLENEFQTRLAALLPSGTVCACCGK